MSEARAEREAFARADQFAAFLQELGARDYGPAALPITRHLERVARARRVSLNTWDRRLHELRNRAVHHFLALEQFNEMVERARDVLRRLDE